MFVRKVWISPEKDAVVFMSRCEREREREREREAGGDRADESEPVSQNIT